MKKRPKSREETPKEGSSNARSATAPQQYAAATHKVQGLSSDFPCNEDIARLLPEKPRFSSFDKEIQWVDSHLHTNEANPELRFPPTPPHPPTARPSPAQPPPPPN